MVCYLIKLFDENFQTKLTLRWRQLFRMNNFNRIVLKTKTTKDTILVSYAPFAFVIGRNHSYSDNVLKYILFSC